MIAVTVAFHSLLPQPVLHARAELLSLHETTRQAHLRGDAALIAATIGDQLLLAEVGIALAGPRTCLARRFRLLPNGGVPKYTPLYDYLRRKPGPRVEMSFVQIERVIGGMLPKSASRPQWWANERSTETRHVQCSAWLDAGFEACLLPREQVVFRRRGASER